MWYVRGLVSIWAVWSFLTALAYIHDPSIGHLQPVVHLMPVGWWAWAWGAAAVLLVMGLVPWRGAGWSRVAGLALVSGLSAAWATSFALVWLEGDTTRGWVSAKNYLFFMLMSSGSAWWISRRGRFDQ